MEPQVEGDGSQKPEATLDTSKPSKRGRGTGRGRGRGRRTNEATQAGATAEPAQDEEQAPGPNTNHKAVRLMHSNFAYNSFVHALCQAQITIGDIMKELEPAFACGLTRPDNTQQMQKPIDYV